MDLYQYSGDNARYKLLHSRPAALTDVLCRVKAVRLAHYALTKTRKAKAIAIP